MKKKIPAEWIAPSGWQTVPALKHADFVSECRKSRFQGLQILKFSGGGCLRRPLSSNPLLYKPGSAPAFYIGSIVIPGKIPISLQLGKQTYSHLCSATSSWILVAKNPCRKTLMDNVTWPRRDNTMCYKQPSCLIRLHFKASTYRVLAWTPSTSLQERVYNWNV